MKKLGWTMLLGLLLACAMGANALAATGVALDGKTYVFTGEGTTFEADGMTFVIEGDTIRVKQAGRADRVLPLEASTDQATVVVEDAAGAMSCEVAASTVTMTGGDAVAVEAVDGAVSSSVLVLEDTAAASAVAVEGTGTGPAYDAYARYGLSYDQGANMLYYQGQRVRLFTDTYPLGDSGEAAIAHFDPAGVVDIEAQRDLSRVQYNPDGSQNPGGTLTGLRALSEAEFAARDLTEWTNPPQRDTSVATAGEPMTAAEKQAFYAPYADLGLSYDAAGDRLMYEGQTVRRFLDIRQSNGESLSGGRFQGAMTSLTFEDGTVDVTINRDYTRPDAEGNGTITGIHVEDAK